MQVTGLSTVGKSMKFKDIHKIRPVVLMVPSGPDAFLLIFTNNKVSVGLHKSVPLPLVCTA